MAYIPSESIATALERSRVGLWIDPVLDGPAALVCKMPEVAIRALNQGARCTLHIGVVSARDRRILCYGLRVDDDPDRPLTIAQPSLAANDFQLLRGILEAGYFRLHFVNELNHAMLSATASFDREASWNALQDLLLADPYLLEPEGDGLVELAQLEALLQEALERFQMLTYRGTDQDEATKVASHFGLRVALTKSESVEIFETSPTSEGGPFRMDETDEWRKLEEAAFLVLDAVYPGKAFHSPHVRTANGTRELADVLAFGDKFICVVQAKALSVQAAAVSRSPKRRSANVMKDIQKALKQLQGATRHMRSGRELLDSDGEVIHLRHERTVPFHAIVLLSEMYAFLDWRRIARKTVEASESETHRALFQVMDLMELSYIAQQARSSDAFENILLQRWTAVQEAGTAYIRGRAPLPQVLAGG